MIRLADPQLRRHSGVCNMKPEVIRFDQSVCSRLDAALRREWLETNGLGGFASSTLTGLNTRRYHGLLVAAATPSRARFALLSKLDATLSLQADALELSAKRHPGFVQPQRLRHLQL